MFIYTINKQIGTIFFSFILALIVFMGMVAVYAWTEPSLAPPEGNIPAPINTGNASQLKSGALGISGLFEAFSDSYLAVDSGTSVGIGTDSPGTDKLKVSGNIQATDDICTDLDGGVCLSTVSGGGSNSSPWELIKIKRAPGDVVIDMVGPGTYGFDFTEIPSEFIIRYKTFRLSGAIYTTTGDSDIKIRFNDDNGANYDWSKLSVCGSTVSGESQSNQTEGVIGHISGSAAAEQRGVFSAQIFKPEYSAGLFSESTGVGDCTYDYSVSYSENTNDDIEKITIWIDQPISADTIVSLEGLIPWE